MFVSSTVLSKVSGSISSSSGPETILLSPGMSAMENRASTVTGSSPDMTFRSMPFSRKTSMVSLQSGLTSSRMEMTETGVRSWIRGSPPGECRGPSPPKQRRTVL